MTENIPQVNEHYFKTDQLQNLIEAGAYVKLGRFTVAEAQIVDQRIKEYLIEKGLTYEEFLEYIRHKDRTSALGKKMSGVSLYVARGLPGRSPHLVKRFIVSVYHTNNHCGHWSVEQDALLLKLHDVNGTKWTIIGRELGRSGANCKDRMRQLRLTRTQRTTNREEWSVEELERLCQVVEEFKAVHGEGAVINWKLIESKMMTRNEFQCKDKWYHALFNKDKNMDICVWIYFNTTPLSHEEDMALCEALRSQDIVYERDIVWPTIISHLPNRHVYNVRRRWEHLKMIVPNLMSYQSFDDLLDAVAATIQKNPQD